MRIDLTRRRVLITGGAGFLGSHLCERRLARGRDVLCVDNPRQRQPDIARARALGFEPTVGLREGLARTVEYFDRLLRERNAI